MLTVWLLSFSAAYKHDLNSLHLNKFLNLCPINISWFLRASDSLRDLKLHVFYFGKHEQCLLVEDFSVIVGLPLCWPTILPYTSRDLPSLYS